MLIAPDRFFERVTDAIVSDDKLEHPQVLDATTGAYPADRRAGIETSVRSQTKSLRKPIGWGD